MTIDFLIPKLMATLKNLNQGNFRNAQPNDFKAPFVTDTFHFISNIQKLFAKGKFSSEAKIAIKFSLATTSCTVRT